MGANKKKVHVMKTRSESMHAYKERMAKLEPQDKAKRAKTVANKRVANQNKQLKPAE